jgi:hypothetical protein
MALVEAMASVAALEAAVEWLLQSGSELALQRRCRQFQKGYQSVTFPGRQDPLAFTSGRLFPGAAALQRIRSFSLACCRRSGADYTRFRL